MIMITVAAPGDMYHKGTFLFYDDLSQVKSLQRIAELYNWLSAKIGESILRVYSAPTQGWVAHDDVMIQIPTNWTM
jgi:hypothetical protein